MFTLFNTQYENLLTCDDSKKDFSITCDFLLMRNDKKGGKEEDLEIIDLNEGKLTTYVPFV
jgi:hypothetical protein